jgi:hypothetical protein
MYTDSSQKDVVANCERKLHRESKAQVCDPACGGTSRTMPDKIPIADYIKPLMTQ